MSAGRFQRFFYETNAGDIASIKLQPETVTGANPSATGPANLPVTAKVTKGVREYGIGARSVSLNSTEAPPAGYKPEQILRVPILTESVWDALVVGNSFTYLGVSMPIVGKNPERIR